MQTHSDTHEYRSYAGPKAEPCRSIGWQGYGFGVNRCNEHVEAIIGGLRYSTRTATLIAAADGEEYGVYLFRTKGGRFFVVRRAYPTRWDRTDPLEIVFQDEALRLYGEITQRGWARFDPLDVAFPGVEVGEA